MADHLSSLTRPALGTYAATDGPRRWPVQPIRAGIARATHDDVSHFQSVEWVATHTSATMIARCQWHSTSRT
eukprot:3753148-Lingulodinium_polyedra.AAC.1